MDFGDQTQEQKNHERCKYNDTIHSDVLKVFLLQRKISYFWYENKKTEKSKTTATVLIVFYM